MEFALVLLVSEPFPLVSTLRIELVIVAISFDSFCFCPSFFD